MFILASVFIVSWQKIFMHHVPYTTALDRSLIYLSYYPYYTNTSHKSCPIYHIVWKILITPNTKHGFPLFYFLWKLLPCTQYCYIFLLKISYDFRVTFFQTRNFEIVGVLWKYRSNNELTFQQSAPEAVWTSSIIQRGESRRKYE